MSDLFRFPAVPKVVKDMGWYDTPPPQASKDLVRKYMERFGVEGELIDEGHCLLVRGKKATLEVFDASGSMWWTKSLPGPEPTKPLKFADAKKAVAMANEYLKKVGLYDDRALPVSVTYTEAVHKWADVKEPVTVLCAQHVNYRFHLDRLPVWGPGAKMQVTFGDGQEVTEVLKFWREPVVTKNRLRVIEPERAFKMLAAHEEFVNLKADSASVVIEEMDLGYYALPPREMQGALIPVYRMTGRVSTKYMERYDFTKYVVAVEYSREEIKKTGIIVTGGGPVF